MTKNEIDLIEDWIKYHGYIFGLENIHIVDGSDDNNVLNIYEKYKNFGLNIHHTSLGLNYLEEYLTKIMHEYKGEDNFLIKLDTDEFLSYLPKFRFKNLNLLKVLNKKHSIFERFLRKLKTKYFEIRFGNSIPSNQEFEAFFNKLPVTGHKYKASFTAWSIPSLDEVSNPIKTLTEFSYFQYSTIKSFFHSDSFIKVDLGCHAGHTVKNDYSIDTGLSIIHYHNVSLQDTIRKAKQVIISHGYIDDSDPISVQKDKIKHHLSQGDIKSYHKLKIYLKYLNHLSDLSKFDINDLSNFTPFFKKVQKSQHINLIKETLVEIEQKRIYDL